MQVTRGQFRAVRRIFKFPLYFLNSLLGCLGCMGSGIVMMKQYPSCQAAWTFSANCIPKLQQNFTVLCRIRDATVLHYLSLSSCQLESTLPPAAKLLLSQCQQGDLVGHHLRLSNILERISRLSCEPLYATNTSHRKQETFLCYVLCIESFSTTKSYNKTLFLGSTLLKHGRRFDYWNEPLNIRMRVCYLSCHEAGLCSHVVIHIESPTSITALLLPFLTYLLTALCVFVKHICILLKKNYVPICKYKLCKSSVTRTVCVKYLGVYLNSEHHFLAIPSVYFLSVLSCWVWFAA
jgi:hypothetical protein